MIKLNIGLIGLGTVGSGVCSLLKRKRAILRERSGVSLNLVKVCDKDSSRRRALKISPAKFTRNPKDIFQDSSIDVVIELIGGIHPAKEYIIEALRCGKNVITANKALLAECGTELFRTAARCNRKIFFEASVGGAVPVIKTLRESLIGNRILSISGIVNGTSNYILTKMSQEGLEFGEAISLAKKMGYAEANPALDIEGIDAAHKITILTMLAFGGEVCFRDVYHQGINNITLSDIAFAREFGYVIKPLAIAKRTDKGIEARVHPTLLAQDHILAKVDGSFNGFLFRTDEAGEQLLYGRGAGSLPTASAVVSDLIDCANKKDSPVQLKEKLYIKPIGTLNSRYYLRFSVIDKPGVLSAISGILGRHRVSISDVIQIERREGNFVPLIMITHEAMENNVMKALGLIDRLRITGRSSQVLRIGD